MHHYVITHKIAFVSERDGNSEIYVMDADGSGLTRVTDNLARDRNPSWSSGGRILGTGGSISATLSAGPRQVTLTATDSQEGLNPARNG